MIKETSAYQAYQQQMDHVELKIQTFVYLMIMATHVLISYLVGITPKII